MQHVSKTQDSRKDREWDSLWFYALKIDLFAFMISSSEYR